MEITHDPRVSRAEQDEIGVSYRVVARSISAIGKLRMARFYCSLYLTFYVILSLALIVALAVFNSKISQPSDTDSMLLKWISYGMFLSLLFAVFYLLNVIYLMKISELPTNYFPRVLVMILLVKLTYYGWAIYGFVVEKRVVESDVTF